MCLNGMSSLRVWELPSWPGPRPLACLWQGSAPAASPFRLETSNRQELGEIPLPCHDSKVGIAFQCPPGRQGSPPITCTQGSHKQQLSWYVSKQPIPFFCVMLRSLRHGPRRATSSSVQFHSLIRSQVIKHVQLHGEIWISALPKPEHERTGGARVCPQPRHVAAALSPAAAHEPSPLFYFILQVAIAWVGTWAAGRPPNRSTTPDPGAPHPLEWCPASPVLDSTVWTVISPDVEGNDRTLQLSFFNYSTNFPSPPPFSPLFERRA